MIPWHTYRAMQRQLEHNRRRAVYQNQYNILHPNQTRRQWREAQAARQRRWWTVMVGIAVGAFLLYTLATVLDGR